MKKCYIGLGGIGCKTLRKFEENVISDSKFVYLDAVLEDLNELGECEKYAVTNQKFGCYQRFIGKDEIKAAIYSGQMPDFIDDFFLNPELELVFVLSSFGGFGSAAACELTDYYGARVKEYRKTNDVTQEFLCKVIAFPYVIFDYIANYLPPEKSVGFETNEIEFINEFRGKEIRNCKWYADRSGCIPKISLYVPYSKNITVENLCNVIGYSNELLSENDIKKNYYFEPAKQKKNAEVFISYSSKNQKIADKLVKCFERIGIKCWIATKSIGPGPYGSQIVQGIKNSKVFVVIVDTESVISPYVKNEMDIATERIRDGLVIMPFKIEDAQMDDECRFYLGRHEWFSAQDPPLEQRIAEFVNKVREILQ